MPTSPDALGTDRASTGTPLERARRDALVAALVCALLALLWAPSVSMERAEGWDESMNAGYPSARMALEARAGSAMGVARAVHDCQQYPFVYPALLAVMQLVTGVSEHACRVLGRLIWCAGLFGLFLAGEELVRRARPARGARLVPWLALGLGALSPLALAYAGSLFLEVPFLVFSTFALRAWLRRGPGLGLRRELRAGAWIAVCFFTKFNYGLLFGFALFLDLLVEAVLELRARRGRELARRGLALAALPAASFAWWFLLPLPLGAATAAAHREAFALFLAGNRDPSMDIDWSIRAVHWTTFFAVTPRMLLVEVLAAALALPLALRPGVRTLWILLFASGLPVWTHGFHLDRFLLPGGLALWSLAALGLGRVLPAAAAPRALAIGALLVFVLLFPSRDAALVLRAVGLARDGVTDYQRAALARFRDLSGDREVPAHGLLRAESDVYLDLLEPWVVPGARVGWIGMSNVFSPAAMQLGLHERGAGDPSALRGGDLAKTFVTLGFVDPGWTREEISAWAEGFDLILTTDPIDLTVPEQRAFLKRYQMELLADGRWKHEVLGTLTVRRPSGEERLVTVYGCRRAT